MEFKTKGADGTYAADSYLVAGGRNFDKPQQEIALVVMVDENRSTIQFSDESAGGKGVKIDAPLSTRMPPPRSASGGFILLRVPIDPIKPHTEENTKSILELILEPK